MKTVSFLILCVAFSIVSGSVDHNASVFKKRPVPKNSVLGVVNPISRCGGVGTHLQLRISECEGFCNFHPGVRYDCEDDFMPSSAAPSLSLKVEICTRGLCFTILDVVLSNSSVQPGFIYTARYSIVPNDFLSGETVEFKAHLYQTESMLLEICIQAEIDIL